MSSFRRVIILANFIAAYLVGVYSVGCSDEKASKEQPYVLASEQDPSSPSASIPAKIHPDLTKVPIITEGRGRETPHGAVCGRYAENGCARAGNPMDFGRYAAPSVDAKHSVGYVGGGAHAVRGEARYANEGTFGYDYSGHWFSRRVWMLWSHGDRHQGGAGAYKTDGPRIIPE